MRGLSEQRKKGEEVAGRERREECRERKRYWSDSGVS